MNDAKTLRLLMPQWQGGDYDIRPSSGQIYPMGARLLAFLAPESDAPLVEVPVEPYTGTARPRQNGIVWQDVLLRRSGRRGTLSTPTSRTESSCSAGTAWWIKPPSII